MQFDLRLHLITDKITVCYDKIVCDNTVGGGQKLEEASERRTPISISDAIVLSGIQKDFEELFSLLGLQLRSADGLNY